MNGVAFDVGHGSREKTVAEMNGLGTIRARCIGCDGALSNFTWGDSAKKAFGAIGVTSESKLLTWRLYQCVGCGQGALATIEGVQGPSWPSPNAFALRAFHPEAGASFTLPDGVPEGIVLEYYEAERCLVAGCKRAAAGMVRSVLDKTLRANGYKMKSGTTLEQQIDAAASDGIITGAMQRRVHEDIRVLGNDVLHDSWRLVSEDDVKEALRYAQRMLEAFYDDRPFVLNQLRAAGKVPHEDGLAPKAAHSRERK